MTEMLPAANKTVFSSRIGHLPTNRLSVSELQILQILPLLAQNLILFSELTIPLFLVVSLFFSCAGYSLHGPCSRHPRDY